MFFILACLFLARRYGTSAAPLVPSFADPPAYDAPIFTRDECSNDCSCPGRSVWDILWSCLATTFAVTWVSVHPNVPYLEEKSWPLLKRRIFLMCLALLAPEVMVMWAFKQWRGAVKIRKLINKARPESCVQWTMTHAHFLQMGGFKVNYRKGFDYSFCWRYHYETNKKRIVVQESVLNFYDFQRLLEEKLIDFPDTTAKEIEDRSKGDALSKGVALLQITWFIIQLLARAHQHLTITEIELTTAALAGINSIMYFFWWSKPLDVRCPIVINSMELEKQLVERDAEKWSFYDDFRLRDYLRDVAQSIIPALATHLRSLAKSLLRTIRASRRLIPRRSGNVVGPEIELQSSTDGPKDSQVTRSHFRRAVEGIWRTCTLVVKKLFYLPYLLMFLPMDMILFPVPSTFSGCISSFKDAKDRMHSKTALHMLFDEGEMEWILTMMFMSEEAEKRPLVIFSALAGAAFGSIHCAAWHFDFPSPVERILWQTTSLSIVGLCLCIAGGIPIHNFVVDKFRNSPSGSKDEVFWKNVRRGLDTIPAIVYPLLRFSLLILALISLRNLPDSAFETVTWTMFIPHI